MLFVIDSDFGLGRNGVAITPWDEWIKNKNDLFIYAPDGETCCHNKKQEFDSNKKILSQCGFAKHLQISFIHQIKKVITGNRKGKTD